MASPPMLTVLLTMALNAISAAPTLLEANRSESSSGRKRAFERVYSEKMWMKGGDGARCASGWSHIASGQGAAAMATLVTTMQQYAFRSLLDVPIGDLCFSSVAIDTLRRGGMQFEYTGLDIVPDLVRSAREMMGDENTSFIQADVALLDRLPSADLVFSRQMMQHQCAVDVTHALRLIDASSARFALLTTFSTEDGFVNSDIGCTSGGYRALDLTKAPYSLPPPIRFFSEQYPADSRVGLGLWQLPLWA